MPDFSHFKNILQDDLENSNQEAIQDTISYLKNVLTSREHKLSQALKNKSHYALSQLDILHYQHLTTFPKSFTSETYGIEDRQFIAKLYDMFSFTSESTWQSLLLTAHQGLFTNALMSVKNFKLIEELFPQKLPEYIQKQYDDNKLGYHTSVEVFEYAHQTFSLPLDKGSLSFAFENKNQGLSDYLMADKTYMSILTQDDILDLIPQAIKAQDFQATQILINMSDDLSPFKHCFSSQFHIDSLYSSMKGSIFSCMIDTHQFEKSEIKMLVKTMAKNFHQDDCYTILTRFFNQDNKDSFNAFFGQAFKMQNYPAFQKYCQTLSKSLKLQESIENKLGILPEEDNKKPALKI